MRVKNKSIIVTGAGGGIGEGIALRLAAEGARVIVNDINEALGNKVVEEILRAGGDAGTPIAAGEGPVSDAYARIARRLIDGGMA